MQGVQYFQRHIRHDDDVTTVTFMMYIDVTIASYEDGFHTELQYNACAPAHVLFVNAYQIQRMSSFRTNRLDFLERFFPPLNHFGKVKRVANYTRCLLLFEARVSVRHHNTAINQLKLQMITKISLKHNGDVISGFV